jgi:hypothetical protein
MEKQEKEDVTPQEKLICFLLNEKKNLTPLVCSLVKTKNFLIETEHEVFHDEIRKQFKERMNSILIQEFSKNFTISPEEAMILFEDISLEEHFEC